MARACNRRSVELTLMEGTAPVRAPIGYRMYAVACLDDYDRYSIGQRMLEPSFFEALLLDYGRPVWGH